ncbi:MAG TPA: hypothetical protein VFZ25_11775 [Chloroflexota bacterium]|nr:hypothetical protein [Chloroflexota bacterium]
MQPQREPMRPQNVGETGVENAQSRRAEARRLRERFHWLNKFSDEEVAKITFCEPGSEMENGDSYFDISNPERGTFSAKAGEKIPEGGCLVSKKLIPGQLWTKLTQFP